MQLWTRILNQVELSQRVFAYTLNGVSVVILSFVLFFFLELCSPIIHLRVEDEEDDLDREHRSIPVLLDGKTLRQSRKLSASQLSVLNGNKEGSFSTGDVRATRTSSIRTAVDQRLSGSQDNRTVTGELDL